VKHTFWTALAAALCLAAPARSEVVCTLLADAASGRVILSQGDGCERRNSPASTFKLAIAAMGYDAGILKDAHSPALPFQPGYPAWRESWKQTTDPTRWLAESVVWYSQVTTRALGMARFQRYVDAFSYGNRDLSGDPGQRNGLTNAWLSSSLQISPAEEVGFIGKLLNGRLPTSARAKEMTTAIVPTFQSGGWTLHGKTGAGEQPKPGGGKNPDRQFGWFVGWATKGGRRIVFARLIKDESRIETPAGFRARDAVIAEWPDLVAHAR
jgi:beta-lactamase class D